MSLKQKIRNRYKIEYGIAHMGGTGIRGKDYFHTRELSKTNAEKVLRKLNKKWEYTTVFKKKGKSWDVMG